MPLTTSTMRAGGVDAALRVFPFFAGLVLHRSGEPERNQIGERLGLLRGRATRLAESGRVREDLDEREIRRLARGRFEIGKLGQIFRDRIGDRELALILQHENRNTGDWLGHGGDPEQRVGRHGPLRSDIGETAGFEVEDLILRDDDRDGAGDFVFRDHRLHRWTDTGKRRLLDEGGQRGGERKDDGEAARAHGKEMYLFCSLLVKCVQSPPWHGAVCRAAQRDPSIRPFRVVAHLAGYSSEHVSVNVSRERRGRSAPGSPYPRLQRKFVLTCPSGKNSWSQPKQGLPAAKNSSSTLA